MKDKKRIIFGLIIFLCVITVSIVYALEYEVEVKWKTEAIEQMDPRLVENTRNSKYNDGYLMADGYGNIFYYNYGDTVLTYRDKDGKELATTKIEDVSRMVADDKNVYLFIEVVNEEDEFENVIRVLNDKLEKVKDIPITREVFNSASFYNTYKYENEGVETISKDGDKVLIYTSKGILSLDIENGTSEILTEEGSLEKYFPLINLMERDTNNKYVSADKDGQVIAQVGAIVDEDMVATIKVEKEGTVLFEKENSEYLKYSNVKIIGDFVVFTASYQAGEDKANDKSDILIYDMKGNLVKKISDNSKYSSITEIESGFVVSKFYTEGTCSYTTGGDVEHWNEESCKTYLTREQYLIQEKETVLGNIEEIVSPETSSLSIICLLLVVGLSFIIIKKSKKKIDFME